MFLPNLVEEWRGACVKIHSFKWYLLYQCLEGWEVLGSIDLFCCNPLSFFFTTHALLTLTVQCIRKYFSTCDQGVKLPQNDLEIYLMKVDLPEISVVCSPGWRTRTDPWAARSKLRNGHFAQRDPETGRAEKTSQTANEAARFKSRPCSSGITFQLRDIWVTVSAFRNWLSGSDLIWCCGQMYVPVLHLWVGNHSKAH